MAKSTQTITRSGVQGSDPGAEQTGSSFSNRLNAYGLYQGTVVGVDTEQRHVTVKVKNVLLNRCIVASSSLAAIIGFTNANLPGIGSRVLVAYTQAENIVVGVIQSLVTYPTDTFAGNITGQYDLKLGDQKVKAFTLPRQKGKGQVTASYPLLTDLVPGEASLDSNMGAAVRVLGSFAQMTAGELAKVETHLFNDMVRIVDNFFMHHSAGGDELIWTNGRCNHESHFTSYGFEAEGKMSEGEPIATMWKEGVWQHFDLPDKQQQTSWTGRWRMSNYIGFLGDMINHWVTDPPTEKSMWSVPDGGVGIPERGGHSRVWNGADGSLVMQSAGGFHVEVAQKVTIPRIRIRWDDPTEDAEEAIKGLNSQYLKLWGQGAEWDDLKVTCWQMRNYAKYWVLWHSLARYRQLEDKGLCIIDTEESCKDAFPTCEEKDKEQANASGKNLYKGYACLNLDPGGNVTLISGHAERGSGVQITMNNGNCHISCAGNMDLTAGGIMALTARDIAIRSMKHIEIGAMMGGLWLKARTQFYALVERGRMWLKSDAYDTLGENQSDADGAYLLSDSPPKVAHQTHGIVIDAVDAPILMYGHKGITAVTREEKACITLQTEGGESWIDLWSMTTGLRACLKKVKWKVIEKLGVESPCSKFLFAIFKIRDFFRMVGGAVIDLDGLIKTKMILSKNGYVGGQSIHVAKDPDVEIDVECECCDEIGDETESMDCEYGEEPPVKKDWQAKEFTNQHKDWTWYDQEKGSYWKDVYGEVKEWNSLKEGIYMDTYKRSEYYPPVFDYVGWQPFLLGKMRTAPKEYSFPGQQGKIWSYSGGSGKALGIPFPGKFEIGDISTVGDMTQQQYYFLSRIRGSETV